MKTHLLSFEYNIISGKSLQVLSFLYNHSFYQVSLFYSILQRVLLSYGPFCCVVLTFNPLLANDSLNQALKSFPVVVLQSFIFFLCEMEDGQHINTSTVILARESEMGVVSLPWIKTHARTIQIRLPKTKEEQLLKGVT